MRKNLDRRKKYFREGLVQEIGDSFLQSSDRHLFTHQKMTDCYLWGGKKFVEAIEKFGVNERGKKLELLGWHREYAELIGDFRVSETLTSGCSQVGKTLFHTLLVCYCLTDVGVDVLWSYDQQTSRDIQVPSNFKPVVKHWLRQKAIKLNQDDKNNNRIHQVSGATVQFVFVSTSKLRDADGTAAAGSDVVGVARDVLFKEERSQYPVGAADPLNRRLDAGRLPSRPIRELGTPGSGNGIEAEIDTADYDFYPHYKCQCCNQTAPLHPLGCLLIKYKGEFLSETGRPLDWKVNPLDSPVFICSICEEVLSEGDRADAYFQCLKTGITLRDFLDNLPTGLPHKRIKAAITLSPLLRMRGESLASEIIQEGFDTHNTSDYQQQVLGIPSINNTNAVTLELFKKAIALPRIIEKPDITIAGGDQGRSEDWLWVCEFYLPKEKGLSVAQIVERTTRHVIFGGDIVRSEVPTTLNYLQVNYGLYDNEPDRTSVSMLCDAALENNYGTVLEMADQRTGLNDAVVSGIVRDGGKEYSCWKIHNEKFLKQVLDGFLLSKYHLPHDWEKWLGNKSERSPLLHLTSPSYDPATGQWKRGKNNLDDLYYAAMFCEAAFFIWLTNKSKKSAMQMLFEANN